MARRDVLDSKRKGTTFPRHFHPRDIPSSFALMICIIFLMLLVLFLNCRNASRIIARNRSIMQIDWAFTISPKIKIFFKSEFSISSAEKH